MTTLFFLTGYLIFLLGVTFFLNNKLNIKVKDLEREKNALKARTKDLELQEKNFAERYAAGKKELADRAVAVEAYYQRAIVEKNEADNIYEHARTHVNSLKQQIKKLQTELANARQKSKRLAKKAKNEQINSDA